MSHSDKELGMDRDITRRDFVNGVAMVAGSLSLPASALAAATSDAEAAEPQAAPDYYPPTRTGMRGSHPGSFEAAHQLRDTRRIDTSGALRTGETYDLIIVGGGLSGLSAAHFFHKDVGPGAKVLVLDNHDDFGGHAKRNELHVGDKTLLINGGTLEIESPERYNQWARQVLDDIGIDMDRYHKANETNRGLYRSLGLRGGYFFDRETFGKDTLTVAPPGGERRYRAEFTEDYVHRMPISDRAKRDLLRIHDPNQPDYLPGLSAEQKQERLARISYRDFLLNVAKVDPQVYWFYSSLGCGVFGTGGDTLPALFAANMGGAGFAGMKIAPLPSGLLSDLPGGHHGRQKEGMGSVHFPDGNATVARLLVRSLIPDAVPGTTQESVAMARVNYALLDRPSNSTRIRLNSVALNVRHDGDVGSAKEVVVTYGNSAGGGNLYQVRGRACVMACWNMFIPYLIPDLPQVQKEALAYNVKAPIVYTSVFVRNWRAFQKLGVEGVSSPTMYHDAVSLTEAVGLGDLQFARTPDDPIALALQRFPRAPGLPRKQQYVVGRADLLATSFETFERNIRDQLARILSPGGFDPAEDILGITVNRWPHGYSYTYSSLYDPLEWVFTESDERPCVKARQPYGLISIANADAAASPHTDAAMLEAHRAIEEVLERRTYPFLTHKSTGLG